jgi:hypothetical protein
VFRSRSRSLVAAVLAAAFLVAAMVPATIAKPPRWTITSTQLVSGGVSSGSDQGFQVTVTNQGPSNISKLYLVAAKNTDGGRLPDKARFLHSSRKASDCDQQGAVLCSFGHVRAGESITVTVAYRVPLSTGKGKVVFELNTSGLVPGGNNSHGDAAFSTQTVRILPKGSGNAAGAWVTDGTFDVANGQKVGARNKQATRVSGKGQFIPVTIKDGANVEFSCPRSACDKATFGEWSKVNVDGGATFAKAFEVRLTIARTELPDDLKLKDVVVYHVLDNGKVDTISKVCQDGAPAKGEPECRTAKLDADGNLVLKVYTYRNGGYKGAF